MKVFLLPALLAVMFASCTHTQKAHTLIKHYLDSALNDPSSYESVSFSNIDTAFTNFTEDTDYINSHRKADSIQVEFDTWKEKYPDFDGDSELSHRTAVFYEKMEKYFDDAKLKQLQIAEDVSKNYKPVFKCWKIEHTYRAKNGFGALGIHTTEFEIDSSFTKIIDADEINN
jgi:hypothetical protein